jgi:hypothetical protein
MEIQIEGQKFPIPENLLSLIEDDEALRAMLTPYFPMAATAQIQRSDTSIELIKQPGRLGVSPRQYLEQAENFIPQILMENVWEIPVESVECLISDAEDLLRQTDRLLKDLERCPPQQINSFRYFL